MKIIDFILYGVSVGLNRGGSFLILPVLSAFLSIKDFGYLSLLLVSCQLLVPFLNLNVPSIIGRTAYSNVKIAFSYTKFINVTLLIILLSLLLCYFFYLNTILLFLCFAVAEAIFAINSTYIRFRGAVFDFFLINLGKITVLLSLFGGVWVYNSSLLSKVDVVLFCFLFSNIVSFSLCVKILSKFSFLKLKNIWHLIVDNKRFLIFSIMLLPHVIAQWVMSSSDRYVVLRLLGEYDLGVYSFAYSLSYFFMLVNSALALALPQWCVKDYAMFSTKKTFLMLFIVVNIVWLFFVLFFYCIFPYQLTNFQRGDVFNILFFVLIGLYSLSFYYYFSSIIFYNMNSKFLSVLTTIVAVLNIILVFILVPEYGLEGAAAATAICYYIYMLLCSMQCGKLRVLTIYPSMFIIVIISIWGFISV
jgi:O-antigen/teichoic acid export membrane protein